VILFGSYAYGNPGDFGLLPTGKPTPKEATVYFQEAKMIRKEIGRLLSG
jgi:hypothetical protein